MDWIKNKTHNMFKDIIKHKVKMNLQPITILKYIYVSQMSKTFP